MKITKRHYAAALKLANDARAAFGRRPVKQLKKGLRGNSENCPIANTIGVDGVYVSPNNEELTALGGYPIIVTTDPLDHELGLIVKGGTLAHQFALAFDDGEIPELIAS